LIARKPEKSVYYADETGIDTYVYRQNVRAKREIKIYTKVRGKKFQRLSVVAGKCGDKIAAPMIFEYSGQRVVRILV
jgi:hypothetical protein